MVKCAGGNKSKNIALQEKPTDVRDTDRNRALSICFLEHFQHGMRLSCFLRWMCARKIVERILSGG
jgi:hypothetical protein